MGAAAAKDAAPEVFAAAAAAAATHRPIDAPVVVAVEDAAAPALADHGVKIQHRRRRFRAYAEALDAMHLQNPS
jgi:hypothetical protein